MKHIDKKLTSKRGNTWALHVFYSTRRFYDDVTYFIPRKAIIDRLEPHPASLWVDTYDYQFSSNNKAFKTQDDMMDHVTDTTALVKRIDAFEDRIDML